jgi:hypothetical protein
MARLQSKGLRACEKNGGLATEMSHIATQHQKDADTVAATSII